MTSIVLAADENYLPYIPCNLAQIARFGRTAERVVLIAPQTLDRAIRTRIEVAAAAFGIELTVRIASELGRLCPRALINEYWHMAASKLSLGDLLPDIDEVLYLDVDTLVRAPLDELLAWELRHPIGGVVELNPGGTHLFGTPRQPYFNAGVLRMSLERMRREQTRDRARELLEGHVFTLPDQDVFNVLFDGRFDVLPLTFNVFDGLARVHRGLAALHDPAIVHFAGSEKPWSSASSSPFAREWRRLYSHAIVEADVVPLTTRPANRPRSAPPGRTRLGSLARAVLPARARRSALHVGLGALESAQARLDKVRATVSPESKPVHALSWGMPSREAVGDGEQPPSVESGRRLDILIGLPGAGIPALGVAIERSHTDVRFLPNLFGGGENESNAGRELRSRVESTLANGEGRCLVPVYPDQLHPTALVDLLVAFRPNLLFLRRAIIFSYISEVRVSGYCGIDPRRAAQYAVRCDSWVDGVAELADSLDLPTTWLTYDGVFATGDDAQLLDRLYPGLVDLEFPDVVGRSKDRSDESVAALVNALADVSPAIREQVLRLPGLTGPPSSRSARRR